MRVYTVDSQMPALKVMIGEIGILLLSLAEMLELTALVLRVETSSDRVENVNSAEDNLQS